MYVGKVIQLGMITGTVTNITRRWATVRTSVGSLIYIKIDELAYDPSSNTEYYYYYAAKEYSVQPAGVYYAPTTR